MTDSRTETLVRIPCIHYSVQFKKDMAEVQALIDSRSEVNTMAPAYAKKLGFWVQKTNVDTQMINGSTIKTYGMVIAGFYVQDKFGKARLFQKTFLVPDTSIEVVIRMTFLTLSKVEIDFIDSKLT